MDWPSLRGYLIVLSSAIVAGLLLVGFIQVTT